MLNIHQVKRVVGWVPHWFTQRGHGQHPSSSWHLQLYPQPLSDKFRPQLHTLKCTNLGCMLLTNGCPCVTHTPSRYETCMFPRICPLLFQSITSPTPSWYPVWFLSPKISLEWCHVILLCCFFHLAGCLWDVSRLSCVSIVCAPS